MLFTSAVEDILKTINTIPELEDGVMFSFDSLSRSKQIEIENKFRTLHSVVKTAIENGIKLEWDEANKENDELIERVAGMVSNDPAFSGWFDRNTNARNAFIERKENGINLSDRIWKPVHQLREEMEIAMTVSIGSGESASTMSRRVRQYLNDPDLMFRRFRYKIGEDKDGNSIYGKKWKKKVKDEKTGAYKWIDYDKDSYRVGRGVYRSSYRNAMRVARTETNIAYRRADNARWQNLDFVLGQEVKTVREHDDEDICDELAGKYPKDFVFDGWHPQCMCYSNPILIDEDEVLAMLSAKRKGESYTSKQKPIEELPENFQNWVLANKESIEKKRAEGKEPYFIRNNAEAVDKIMANEQPLTTLEKAELRHKARTKEQEETIRKRWAERKAVNKSPA